MARIVVVPERMLDLSQQMRREADRLREIESSLGRALGGLEWEVRRRSNVEGQVQAARGQARALAERAEQMARFLAERATAFQQADAEGAQSLGEVIKGFLSAGRSILPQLAIIAAYMTAGRTNMQRFLDLVGIRRYGPLAPWLKIGVLDQRYKIAKSLGIVGVGLGIASDVVTADRIDGETVSVAVIRNVGELLVGATAPPVAIALAGNALVQLGGTGIVLASRIATPVLATSQAMAEDLNTSTDRLEAAFQRVDLGRITKDISEIVYDLTLKSRFEAIEAAWRDPSLTNLAALTMALNPAAPFFDVKETLKDLGQLSRDAFDFALGVPDLVFALESHINVLGNAAVARAATLLPIPDAWKGAITNSCERAINDVISHPVTVERIWQTVTEGIPSLLMDRSVPVSWANSLQFAPVQIKA